MPSIRHICLHHYPPLNHLKWMKWRNAITAHKVHRIYSGFIHFGRDPCTSNFPHSLHFINLMVNVFWRTYIMEHILWVCNSMVCMACEAEQIVEEMIMAMFSCSWCHYQHGRCSFCWLTTSSISIHIRIDINRDCSGRHCGRQFWKNKAQEHTSYFSLAYTLSSTDWEWGGREYKIYCSEFGYEWNRIHFQFILNPLSILSISVTEL